MYTSLSYTLHYAIFFHSQDTDKKSAHTPDAIVKYLLYLIPIPGYLPDLFFFFFFIFLGNSKFPRNDICGCDYKPMHAKGTGQPLNSYPKQ